MWCILFPLCDQITARSTNRTSSNVCQSDMAILQSNVMGNFLWQKTAWSAKRTSQNIHTAWKELEWMPRHRWCGDSAVCCEAICSLVRSKNCIERVRMHRNPHITRGQSAVTSSVTSALKSTQNPKTGFDQIRVFDQYGAHIWAHQSHKCHCNRTRCWSPNKIY